MSGQLERASCVCGHDEAAHYKGYTPCQGDQGHCECPTFDPNCEPDEMWDSEPWK